MSSPVIANDVDEILSVYLWADDLDAMTVSGKEAAVIAFLQDQDDIIQKRIVVELEEKQMSKEDIVNYIGKCKRQLLILESEMVHTIAKRQALKDEKKTAELDSFMISH